MEDTAQCADDSGNKRFESEEFRLYCYKILPCSKRYSHDWSQCPFAHPSERAKRRDFRIYTYDCIMCPAVERGEECAKGLNCPHSHNAVESWLHPQKYRTLICKDRDNCTRPVCFFAHGSHDLRMPCEPDPPAPPAVHLQDATTRYLAPNGALLVGSGGCHQHQTNRCSADYSSSANSSLQLHYVSAAPADAVGPASCGMYNGGGCIMSPAEARSPANLALLPHSMLPAVDAMQQVPPGAQLPQQFLANQCLAGQQQPAAVASASLPLAGVSAAAAVPPQVAAQVSVTLPALQPRHVAVGPLISPPQQLLGQQQLLVAQQHQMQQTDLLQSQQLQQQLQQLHLQNTQRGGGLLDPQVCSAADVGTSGAVHGGAAAPQQALTVLSSSCDTMPTPQLAINRFGSLETGCNIMPAVPARPSVDQCNIWPLAAGGRAVDADMLLPTASASSGSDLLAAQALVQNAQGGYPQCVGSPVTLGPAQDPFAASCSFNNLMAAFTPAAAPMQPQQLPAGSVEALAKQTRMHCVSLLQPLTITKTTAHQGLDVPFADSATSWQQLGSSLMHAGQLSSLLPPFQQLGGNHWDGPLTAASAGLMSVPALRRGPLPPQQQGHTIGSLVAQQQQQHQLVAQGVFRGLTPTSAGITLRG